MSKYAGAWALGLWAMLALSPSYAQDAVSASKAKPAKAKPKSAAPGLGMSPEMMEEAGLYDAQWADGQALEAEKRARCLRKAAGAVKLASGRLKRARKKQVEERRDALDTAMGGLHGCEDLSEPKVDIVNAVLKGDVCKGDPLCASDVELEARMKSLLSQRRHALRDCYERGLARHPDLAGAMDLDVAIGAGEPLKVERVTVHRDELGEPIVRRCIAKKIRGLAPVPAERAQKYRLSFRFSR